MRVEHESPPKYGRPKAGYPVIRVELDTEVCRRIVQSQRWTSKVTASQDGCLLWTGARTSGGYPNMTHHGRTLAAHRVAWVAHHGIDVPPGYVIDHRCRRRTCVNPLHLEAVPQSENLRRGIGPILTRARHARKVTCKRGHPLDGVSRRGWRYCRTCQAQAQRESRTRRSNGGTDPC